jgi:hypothetical protein
MHRFTHTVRNEATSDLVGFVVIGGVGRSQRLDELGCNSSTARAYTAALEPLMGHGRQALAPAAGASEFDRTLSQMFMAYLSPVTMIVNRDLILEPYSG